MSGRTAAAAGIVLALMGRATPAVSAGPDASCATAGTAVYYGNGVNTPYDRAQEIADDDLPGLADEANVNDVVAIGIAYNHTDGLLEDIIQTLEQKEAEDHRFGWFLLNNVTAYLVRGLNVLGIINLPPGGPALVATLQAIINQGIVDSNTQTGTFYDSDVADQVSSYDQDLRVNGNRVVVIAHSQGNLYANASSAALVVGGDAGLIGSFAIVGVADPAEITFNGYVTSDDDVVINTLRTLGRTVLPANVHVQVSAGDFLGHGFEEVYINAQLPARAKVVALFSTISTALPYPSSTGDGACGAPGPNQCRYGPATSTEMLSGSVAHGNQNLYALQASAGQGVFLRVAEVGNGVFVPAFKVYDPSGAIVVNGANGSQVASYAFAAQKSGTYTVAVYDTSSSATAVGVYNLYVVVAPGTDACGTLVPGGVVSAQLAEGALDSYTFTAQAGQGFGIRVTDVDGGSLVPAFIVYDPTGTVVVNGANGGNVASFFLAAQKSGTYTVVVYDDSSGYASTGNYNLYFTLAPGANKGGALVPGAVVSAQLAEGALDSYTFTAQAGQGFGIRVTDVDGGSLVPAFIVYDPTGTVVVNGANGGNVASFFLAAQKSGTYTVVVYDDSSGYASTGNYNLYFTLAPGANKGGALVPGAVVSAQLAEGALDSYTFTAQAGQGFGIRVTDVDGGSLVPAFIVYDPTGTVVVNGANGGNVASFFLAAQKSGTYTVVVYDDSSGYASTGNYNLYFTLAPGANKGGALVPGAVVFAQLAEGALDSYTFTAQAGQGFGIRVTDVDGGSLVPAFIVYDPTGTVVVNGANGGNVASFFLAAQKSGTYTVVVYDDSSGYASTGNYNLYFTLAPGANKGGALVPGAVVFAQLAEGALDSYTFSVATGETVAISVTDLSAGTLVPAFIAYDPAGAVVVNGANGATVASASFRAQKVGTYTLVVYDDSSGYASTGGYSVSLSVTPPTN